MNLKFVAGVFVSALLASPAVSAETLLFGAPSSPTVWGHEVKPSNASVQIKTVDLRRSDEPEARGGFVPSEPTIWGHRPERSR
ncbi:hypothetical protein [Hansschlegelia sp. KR7-227]|uniref:hypothetical protein n=1 Tax=Hansschlegelia sp. KR7-227 TaxID=3400914 RepID=UPI003C06ABE7